MPRSCAATSNEQRVRVEVFSKISWNGLTNEYHPTQILADFLTLREHFGKLQGLKFAYMAMPATTWATA